jgi:uncharacterized protein YheU (UPF0270 family)
MYRYKGIEKMIEIPPHKLPADLLTSVIEEFINRDGTDYGDREISLKEKIEHARVKISQGDVILTFDQETETCNLLSKNDFIKITQKL